MKTTKVLLYCTKAKPVLLNLLNGTDYRLDSKELWKEYNPNDVYEVLNGKIVAECEVEVEKIVLLQKGSYYTPTLNTKELLEKSCLTKEQLSEYLKEECGYALHIKNLRLADKPRILNYFFKGKLGSENSLVEVTKAPQNMMYVYTSFELPEIVETEYVLISIRPEWLCKILNGKKTIEVRRKVLKEMISDE